VIDDDDDDDEIIEHEINITVRFRGTMSEYEAVADCVCDAESMISEFISQLGCEEL